MRPILVAVLFVVLAVGATACEGHDEDSAEPVAPVSAVHTDTSPVPTTRDVHVDDVPAPSAVVKPAPAPAPPPPPPTVDAAPNPPPAPVPEPAPLPEPVGSSGGTVAPVSPSAPSPALDRPAAPALP